MLEKRFVELFQWMFLLVHIKVINKNTGMNAMLRVSKYSEKDRRKILKSVCWREEKCR